MLLSLCQDDSLTITKAHFDQSLEIISDIEAKLGRGLSVLGKNPHTAVHFEIMDYIKAQGPVERGKLLARFWQKFPTGNADAELGQVLDVLTQMGEIQRVAATLNTKEAFRVKKA